MAWETIVLNGGISIGMIMFISVYLFRNTTNEVMKTFWAFMIPVTMVVLVGYSLEALKTSNADGAQNLTDLENVYTGFYAATIFGSVFFVGMILFFLIKALLEKLNNEASRSMEG